MKKTTNPKYLLLLLALFLSVQMGFAQEGLLKGKVTDAGGESLIGAQVKWKDAKTGTITDVDGNYSIVRSKTRNVLVVSYVGYKSKEVEVAAGQATVDVTMSDDAQHLDELIVVGYGIQKKSSITGSVETVKAEDLLMMPTTNIDQALTGQVAGLQVMQSTGDPSSAREADLHIRGINSSPLFVFGWVSWRRIFSIFMKSRSSRKIFLRLIPRSITW